MKNQPSPALDINSFTTNGKNYRAADRLNLASISDFLAGKGYTVLSIEQPWRNIWARLEKDGKQFFFKLASTDGVGERIRNEIDWNRYFSSQKEATKEAGFIIPSIEESGKFDGLVYYIAEYFDGPMIAESNMGGRNNIVNRLEQITDCHAYFLSLPTTGISLYRDKEFPDDQQIYTKHLIERVLAWSAQIPERDLSGLELMIEGFNDYMLTGVNHGDMVPWHMIEQDGYFVLIDGEHGSTRTVRYYDIAYFYHRIATRLEDPSLADQYLDVLFSKLPKQEQEQFLAFFPIVLASRTIGGFFDAKHDGTDFAPHDALRDRVLSGAIMRRLSNIKS